MNNFRLRELKLELNRNCPLYCIHCSSNGMPGAPEELGFTEITKLLNEFVLLGGEKLSISGGEPLCHPSISDVIESSLSLGLETSIYSTGIINPLGQLTSISDDLVRVIAENHIKFIFSIHGSSAETHDHVTQREGSFDATLVSINKLKHAGAIVEAHIVPTNINIDELPELTNLLVSLGIPKVSWLRFVPQGRGETNKPILSLTKQQLYNLTNLKKELALLYPNIEIRTGAPFNILCPEEPVGCSAGINILTIRPDGYAAPCDAFKQFMYDDPFSNILNFSLAEVWHHSNLLNTVRRIQELSPSSSCSSCSQYSRCKSGCIAQKAVAAGMLIDGKDPECLLKGVEVDSEQFERVSV